MAPRASGPLLACGATVAAVLLATPALAGTATLEPGQSPATPRPSEPVRDAGAPVFIGSLYIWGTALTGRSSTLPPLPETDIDISFSDVLKDFDGGIMGATEMRAGRWSVIGDVLFTQVTPKGNLPGPASADAKVRSRSLTLQADALYRFHQSEFLNLDAGAGLRFWYLDNKLTIDPGLLRNGVSHSESEYWVDPVIAGRVNARIAGPWSATLVGDVGGFDVGSQLTWQFIGTLNYQWNEDLSLRLGYRALSVDYKQGDFLYDVRMQGPIVGVSYRF